MKSVTALLRYRSHAREKIENDLFFMQEADIDGDGQGGFI